ncbi:MAG TPA: hypothetical protein VFQ78_00125 [Candidatus Udaeobacter sp.]|jgi:hypothetical protein|nr:hypothetical protein [Candidatus Udaeobacter sp.]
MIKSKISSLAFILTTIFICAPQLTQAQYQTRNMHFGVSGGNIKDHSQFYCCSGTLGSLVTDGTAQYVLSNNHVLARQDRAAVGEDISQPGLVDTGCSPSTRVADFTKAVTLGNNVDCAVAAVRTGTMDSTGFIEGYGGPPSKTIVSPSVGLAVAKSGRTTGHTTGTIGSTNTSVAVQYQIKCGTGRTYILNYTNQVVINSTTFSMGGDSGSLITTNDGCYHPVALLFAGSSNTTIANPISEVLTKLNAALGRTLTFVGTNCADAPFRQAGAQSFQLPKQALDQASRVLEQNRQDLMGRSGVLGVGLGALEDNSAPAIIVYVDKTSSSTPQLAAQIDSVPVRIIMTDPFVAF